MCNSSLKKIMIREIQVNVFVETHVIYSETPTMGLVSIRVICRCT